MTHSLIVDTIERHRRTGKLVRAVAQCRRFVYDEAEDAKAETPTCEECVALNQQDEGEDAVNPLLRASLR